MEIVNLTWAVIVGLLELRDVVFDIINCVQTATTFICVWLMLEHNNHSYVKLTNFCNALKLCWCCSGFVYSSIYTDDDDQVITKTDRQVIKSKTEIIVDNDHENETTISKLDDDKSTF